MASNRFRAVVACGGIVLAAAQVNANGGALDVLGLGGDSGKLAKLEFRLHDSIDVTALAWSPDGRYIATGSAQSNLIHIWDVRQRSIVKELRMEASAIAFHSLAWSPDGHYLAACGKPVLHVYATDSWQDAKAFSASIAGGCIRPAFSSDNREMALLTEPRYVRVFSVPGWELIRSSDRDSWGKWGLRAEDFAYLPGTHTLVLAGSEYLERDKPPIGEVWVLRSDETDPTTKFQAYCCFADGHGGAGSAFSMAVSPDGHHLATGTNTGGGTGAMTITQAIHLFDAATGQLVGAPLDGVPPLAEQRGLAYTPDGRFLLVGHADQKLQVVHVVDAKRLEVVDVVHTGNYVEDVAANPRGSEFAAGVGRQVLVWSLPPQH